MNKKILLLPILWSFLLTGCKFTIFGKTIYLFEKPEEKQPEVIPDVDPEDMHQHAVSLSYTTGSPSAPFYLKIGETRNLGVSLSPAPDLDNEKTVNWKVDTENVISYIISENDTKKITVTGEHVGTTKLTATNDYNPQLTYTFTVKVIDFDEENEYLWQYTSDDRKSFGYIYQERPEGVTEGDAALNGINWHFTRSKAVTLQSSMGALGFGRGEEPETHIHLESDNIRAIEKFTIEAGSANSLAKMTIKVGDTIYMNEKVVPSDYFDEIRTIYSDDVASPASGKIEIDIVTPEFDPTNADPGYKKPGAFHLKSILIKYSSEVTPATQKTYDFKALYEDTESDFYKSLKKDAAVINYADDDFSFTFHHLAKESEKVPGYATTNGDIEIKLLRPNEVFYKVEAKFDFGTLASKPSYTFEKSKTGGLTYYSTGISISKETGEGSVLISEDHQNAINLKYSGSSYIGLVSIKVTTLVGNPYSVKEIAVPEEFEPTKKEYIVGEEFSIDGLPDLSIEFNEEGVRPEVLPVSSLTWYDGPSYDKDASKAKTTLDLGTTKVYGIYKSIKVVEITGITVKDDPKTLTLVKDVSDIEANTQYFLVAKAAKQLVRGSTGSDMGKKAGMASLGDAALGETITISGAYRNDYFMLEKNENGQICMKSTTDHYLGMTASGGISRAANPESNKGTRYFTLTVDENGIATIKYEIAGDTPKTGYLYFKSSTLDMSVEATANLAFYKLAA